MMSNSERESARERESKNVHRAGCGRSRWEALHAGLMRSIDARDAARSYAELRRQAPALAAFGEPAAVAAFLARRDSSLAERDRVLRCLVAEASKGGAKRLALALLFLGLWPGLDSIFRKRTPLFQPAAHDLELEIVDRFTAQVHRIDLARVTCLAATLVMNTEREIVDVRLRERARAARCESIAPEAIAAPPADDEDARPASRFGLPPGQTDVEEVAALRRWLFGAVGRDADLIVDAVIHQRSRLELAAALGISHAAARKRLERALCRARQALLTRDVSQAATAAALGN
jgi:RNA polymerase sigma-70 factor (ECF subfamily)